MVNETVSSLLRYAPDSLLGQDISFVLPLETCSEIFKQIVLMREHQCAHYYEWHVEALSDMIQNVPVHAILLDIAENSESKSSIIFEK
jgi:hypothetical protein